MRRKSKAARNGAEMRAWKEKYKLRSRTLDESRRCGRAARGIQSMHRFPNCGLSHTSHNSKSPRVKQLADFIIIDSPRRPHLHLAASSTHRPYLLCTRLLLVVRRKQHQPPRAVAATCAPVFPRLSPSSPLPSLPSHRDGSHLLRVCEGLILLKDIDPVTAYRISQRPPRYSSSSRLRHPDFLR